MDLSEVTAGTPKVLKHCLELFHTPAPYRENSDSLSKTAPVTSAKFDSHPDIQFFRLVKTKHHYAYHKSKKTSGIEASLDKIHLKLSVFDPYSRDLLLQRLRTYNALNWSIPPSPCEVLSEVVCASNGWICESIARNNKTKNHLKCTSCGNQIILRFNSVDQQPAYAPFQFDVEDIQALNDNLKAQYVHQIQDFGHASTCPWIKFHTPLMGVYYLTPYISTSNETLIADYLDILRNLTENLAILQQHSLTFGQLVPAIAVEEFSRFSRISNSWLLSRYFKENKENIASVLERLCLPWLYWLAAMGWNLNIQRFSSQTVLLLICTKCNQRVFLHKDSEKTMNSTPAVSSSKILTPCEFPAHIQKHSQFSMEYLDEMEDDEEPDTNLGHKPWCFHVTNMANHTFYEYFMKMILELEKNIGPNGEYMAEKDMALNLDTGVHKRRNNIDVNEGLDRLTKLRKLYFVE